MPSDYLRCLLSGLPDPAVAPEGFYTRISPELWSHILPIIESVGTFNSSDAAIPSGRQVRLYMAALSRIAIHWWNPYKYGLEGSYNDVPDIQPRATYMGHNIAALAVDETGRVVDFEMNHNEILRSSAEHAESRLVRRLYQLASVYRTWDELSDRDFSSARIRLDKVTIYTTLQPCAQCAGMMTLAKVKQAVFLQADPGMYFADVIMRALSPDYLRAPAPLPASLFGIEAYDTLNRAYTDYWSTGMSIHTTQDGAREGDRDITAFLCTHAAYDAIRRLADEFPDAADEVKDLPGVDTALLIELDEFIRYATSPAPQRGAPHRV